MDDLRGALTSEDSPSCTADLRKRNSGECHTRLPEWTDTTHLRQQGVA